MDSSEDFCPDPFSSMSPDGMGGFNTIFVGPPFPTFSSVAQGWDLFETQDKKIGFKVSREKN